VGKYLVEDTERAEVPEQQTHIVKTGLCALVRNELLFFAQRLEQLQRIACGIVSNLTWSRVITHPFV